MSDQEDREVLIEEIIEQFQNSVANGDFMQACSTFMALISSGSQFELKIDSFDQNAINDDEDLVPTKYESYSLLYQNLKKQNYGALLKEQLLQKTQLQKINQQLQAQSLNVQNHQQYNQQNQHSQNQQQCQQQSPKSQYNTNVLPNNAQVYQNNLATSPHNNDRISSNSAAVSSQSIQQDIQDQYYSTNNPNLPQNNINNNNNNTPIMSNNNSQQSYNSFAQYDSSQNFIPQQNAITLNPIVVKKQMFAPKELMEIYAGLSINHQQLNDPAFQNQTMDQIFLNYLSCQQKIL